MKVKEENVPALRFPGFSGEWKRDRFGKIVRSLRLGGNYTNVSKRTEYPLIKMGNLGRGNIVLDKLDYIQRGEFIDENDRIIEGDLFFNTRNTLYLVGKVAIWRGELDVAYYNSNLLKLTFEDNYFMNYQLNAPTGIRNLRRIATGTTSVAAIYTKDLKKVRLSMPTLPEQQKIASFLTAVDSKIEQLSKKKTLLEQFKKGMMQKLFSQELRFKDEQGNEFSDWRKKPLREFIDPARKITYGIVQPGKFVEQGVPLVRGGDYSFGWVPLGQIKRVTKEIDLPYKRSKLQSGDLLLTIVGANTGTVAVVPDWLSGANITQTTARIAINNIQADSRFVKQCLLSSVGQNEVKRYVKGAAQPGLNLSDVEKFMISAPSLPEQKKIADFLTSIDKKINLISTELNHAQSFKKSLLQQMFV
jgi:type I restriction enzyme S subunit